MRQDEKIIKEIIKKYGSSIDLKKSPYLMTEIIRNYSGLIESPMTNENPCGGTPPEPPKPGKLSDRNPREIYEEISRISDILTKLNKKIDKLLK